MKTRILFSFTLLFILFIVGCGKEDTQGSVFGKLTRSEVIGSYYYLGYSGPLKRELEITFDSDQTGYGEELSYGSSGNLLSAHAYSFTWTISGNKLQLKGVSGRADSDGDVGANDSWSAEFEYLYGMIVPGKPFIAGYAEHAVFSMIDNKIDEYIECKATLNKLTGDYTININTRLDDVWKDIYFKYGVSWNWGDYQWGEQNGNQVKFNCETELDLFYDIVEAVNEKEKTEGLTQNDRDLRDNALDAINQYINDFQRGSVSFRVGVNAAFSYLGERFDRTFVITPQYYVTEGGNSGNNNGSGDNNGNSNTTLLPGASGSGTLASPFNIAGAINAVKSNDDKETLARYYVKGRISYIKYPFDQGYGTAVFDITDDGRQNENYLKCFSIYFLENESWKDGYQQISVGDDVIVYGVLGKWNDSYYETVEHKAYIYSLNGETSFTLLTAVDLGLSVKWANMNLGASSPEKPGNHYAWGETEPKSNYSWNNYKWRQPNYGELYKYCPLSQPNHWAGSGSPDGLTTLVTGPEGDDAASKTLGGKWRMPTRKEISDLVYDCDWTATTMKGKMGYEVKSRVNGNSIFIPMAGSYDGYDYTSGYNYDWGSGEYGHYWSSSLNSDEKAPFEASSLDMEIDPEGTMSYRRVLKSYRYQGYSIRPVME